MELTRKTEGGEKEVGQNVEDFPNNQTDNGLKETPKLNPDKRRYQSPIICTVGDKTS